ncbi:hypothetical protein BGZ63DRAFT_357761 [Mariannaea sp. PMI_226]|nr:hypothetical protein BGZ63DRAFT_357761 [Mariannaea sp. PMI_226]
MESQPEPLQVLIVGAGISGLTAAIGLRKNGHRVTVFERSDLHNETGAAIHIAPNAHGILRRLGVYPELFGANPVNGVAEYDAKGNLRFKVDLRQSLKIWQHPWMLSHRIQLHEALKEHAVDTNGVGLPVVLRKLQKVTHVDPETATIILEDGTTVTGDLILGADGVSSVTRKAVVGDDIKPFSSGKSAFRFMVPCADILSNETTRKLVHEGQMTMWMGDDRRLVMYPCSDNKVMNFVGIHPCELSTSEWDGGASKEVLLEVYTDFGFQVQTLLSLVDSTAVKVWTLLDMERIPRWIKGRVALIGDAAHPFLPHQGQGGGVAIEDAASIFALLPPGASSDDVPERLALFERLRDERAHKIQEYTRQAGADLNDENRDTFNINAFVNYNFGHDEFDNSTHSLKRLLVQRNGPCHLRQPIAFGPSPSPRQDYVGRKFVSHNSKFKSYSLRFKTSATYLKTLFPTKSFSFQSQGTVAEAMWMCTKLDNMAWLGGKGYYFVGFWINGVEYTKTDGDKIYGSYLPLLFENSSDPILTGRDELGMPKLFCDIEVQEAGSASTITCSRGEVEVLKLTLGTSEEVQVGEHDKGGTTSGTASQSAGHQSLKDDGEFVYRYVPAVGRPGVADAEYPVFLSKAARSTQRVVERVWRGLPSKSSIQLEEKSQQSLPTLHHITQALSQIPVYEILDVKVEEGHGVDDFSGAQRVE